MELSHIIVLALVQGISEFLPISSSAHLVLVPKLLGWADQGLAFDVAVHVGTLAAILFYFKPVGLFGLAFNDAIEQYARNGLVIAAMTIIFGIALYVADKKSGLKTEYEMTIKLALIVGLAQAIALIPGVSRSGVTMTAALMLGFSHNASANFSFLLSIPVIVLAGGLEAVKLLKTPDALPWSDLAIGAAVSGLSAYLCVRLFMALIARASMLPFVIYRMILGVFLFAMFL